MTQIISPVSPGNEPEKDPLQAAYQRLKEAYDAVQTASHSTLPLAELAIVTDELKNAKETFLEQLEYDQRENTIEIRGHILWKREYEALEELARLNNNELTNFLTGIKVSRNGRITGLRLNNLSVVDLSPLRTLAALERLDLGNNLLEESMENTATIRILEKRRCYVQGYIWSSEYEKLERFAQYNNCRIEDFQKGIIGTEKGLITRIALEDKRISDLSPLIELQSLRGLFLKNNQISDLTPLAALPTLTTLDLNNNKVSDLSPLSSLTGLEVLFLEENQVADISPLTGLTALSGLLLSNNQISNIHSLTGLTGLKTLSLKSNSVTQLGALSSLALLEHLYLEDNPVSDSHENKKVLRTLRDQGCAVKGILL